MLHANTETALRGEQPASKSKGIDNKSKLPRISPFGTNVNDGQHQLAILQDGERVLNPAEAQQYRSVNGPKENAMQTVMPRIPLYDEGGDVETTKDERKPVIPPVPTLPEQPLAERRVIALPEPAKQAQATPEPAQPLIPKAAAEETKPTMGSTIAKQWLSKIVPPQALTPQASTSESTEKQVMPRIQAQPAQEFHQEAPATPLIPGAPTSETPREQRDLRNMERKAQVADLERQSKAALQSGDMLTADKLKLAAERLKETPWGDRSGLSKFGKIVGTVGKLGGDIMFGGLPSAVLSRIPGTEENRAAKREGLLGRIETESAEQLREAQASAANAKESPKQQFKVVPNAIGPNGRSVIQNENTGEMQEAPVGFTPYKEPAPEKAETHEQHLNRFAELKNQVESGKQLNAQDQKEYDTLKTELTVPDATVDSYNKQIDATLNAAHVPNSLWNNYHIQHGATAEQAKQSIEDANRFSGETYQQGAEGRKENAEKRAQDRKDKNTPVYVETDQGVVLTTQYDLDNREGAMKGRTLLGIAEPVKSGDVKKDKDAIRMLNEVQTNTNRYNKSLAELAAHPDKITDEQRRMMTVIFATNAQVGNGLVRVGTDGGISISGAFPQWKAQLDSRTYDQVQEYLKDLSKNPLAMQLMTGYLRTAASVPTYLKAISGIGRSNKETLDLELQNVPAPYLDPVTATDRMQAWQENMNVARSGFPTNLPEMKVVEPDYTPPNREDVVRTGTFNNQTIYQLKNGKTVYKDGRPAEVK